MKFRDDCLEEFARSGQVRALLEEKAEQGAAVARANAPVNTGAYRDSIHVEVGESARGAVAHIVASSEHSMIVESQTGNLARALRSISRG